MTNLEYILNNKDKKTAYVFAGGGSLGAVQVGMLKAITVAGIEPDLLAGSSVGAINAAFFAGDPTIQGANALERIWHNISRKDIFPINPMRAALALVSKRESFVNPKPLTELLVREIQFENLEDPSVGLHIVATDAMDGSFVLLSKGDVVTALLASTAIPGVFPPTKFDGKVLIDGGVTNNTPILAAIQKGADRIIILPTGSPCVIEEVPKGPLPIMLQALNLMIITQLVRDVEFYSKKAEIIVVPPLCPINTNAHDFSNTKAMIEMSYESTHAWLKQDANHKVKIPGSLYPHKHEDGHVHA